MSKPKEYYQELLDGFTASRKNVLKFCKSSGITRRTYYYTKGQSRTS